MSSNVHIEPLIQLDTQFNISNHINAAFDFRTANEHSRQLECRILIARKNRRGAIAALES